MDLIENPTLVHELVRISVEHTKSLVKKAVELGADLFVFGDDYGGENGTLMSSSHFELFFLPGMTDVVQTTNNLGAYTIKHTDGNITSILPMIVETGIHGIHPLDPEAGMDIGEVKKLFGDKVCVIGNIDTGKVLTESTPKIVEETLRKAILKLAPGGGYIIASANSIHPHVQPENYIAMLLATRQYGNYKHLGEV